MDKWHKLDAGFGRKVHVNLSNISVIKTDPDFETINVHDISGKDFEVNASKKEIEKLEKALYEQAPDGEGGE